MAFNKRSSVQFPHSQTLWILPNFNLQVNSFLCYLSASGRCLNFKRFSLPWWRVWGKHAVLLIVTKFWYPFKSEQCLEQELEIWHGGSLFCQLFFLLSLPPTTVIWAKYQSLKRISSHRFISSPSGCNSYIPWRIIKSLRLEKTTNIIWSNRQSLITMPTKHVPQCRKGTESMLYAALILTAQLAVGNAWPRLSWQPAEIVGTGFWVPHHLNHRSKMVEKPSLPNNREKLLRRGGLARSCGWRTTGKWRGEIEMV